MQKEREYAYYQWSLSDIIKHFDVDPKIGLTEKKAKSLIEKYGLNFLGKLKERSIYHILWGQITNFFVILLGIAAIISYFVDGLFQSTVLIAIILLNVLLGFFQEYKAEKALASLKNLYKTKNKVIREGKTIIIPSEEITRGDIILLETGDKIPADLRVLECQSLKIDESSLTGESLPVEKKEGIVSIDTALGDRFNMLFGSTIVVSGRGFGIVTAIGKNTEFGKIASLVQKNDEKTPLEIQTIYIGKVLSYVSIIIVLFIFLLGFLRGYETLPLLTFTIALLVGAVPESLPTIITLALAIGVLRMSSKKAIVRKLAVIDSLGTVDIIATDKTGTLTNNKLSIGKVVSFDSSTGALKEYDISGGRAAHNSTRLFQKAVACSNINIGPEGIIGDPIDIAIAEEARLYGVKLESNHDRIFEIPFDSEKKYMAVIIDKQNGKELIAKGAPERILSYSKLSKEIRQKALDEAALLAKNGFKVIAIASKKISKTESSELSAMEFIGMFALIDEPSPGIKEVIKTVIAAGIKPIMITGDHPETARYIANKVGFNVGPDELILGQELEKLTHTELKKTLAKVKVFARVSPEDKINIVKALRESGFSVAFMGDGVNDAPAIKESDVGIAMGIRGTEVAKDSSDIILSDDKYKTIITAIEYGRAIYDNIISAIIFFLSGNFSALFLIGATFIFGLPVPLLTLQILWINMITDSLPALALAFEAPSKGVLYQKPRNLGKNSMKRPVLYAFLLAIIGFILGLIIYLWGLESSIEKARTLVFSFFVFLELAYIFSIRSKERIWQNVGSFFKNKYMLVSIAISILLQLVIFIKPLSETFQVIKLSSKENIILAILIMIGFFLAEIVRYIFDIKELSSRSFNKS